MTEKNDYKVTSLYRTIDFVCTTSRASDLFITYCGFENIRPNHKVGPWTRQDYHLHMVLSGRGTYTINGITHHLSAGQLFVVPEGALHEYQADAKEPWSYAWITFNGPAALPTLQAAGFKNTWIRDANFPIEQFEEIVNKLISCSELTSANEMRRNGYLREALALLLETKTPEKELRHEFSQDTYVKYALQFIYYNYASIKVNDIAEYIGINRSYLTTIFKNKLDVSPQEYLLNFRLNKGKQLLSTTDLSIQEIAAQIGYDNPLTFSKMFKHAYGKSPRTYRKEMSGTADSTPE